MNSGWSFLLLLKFGHVKVSAICNMWVSQNLLTISPSEMLAINIGTSRFTSSCFSTLQHRILWQNVTRLPCGTGWMLHLNRVHLVSLEAEHFHHIGSSKTGGWRAKSIKTRPNQARSTDDGCQSVASYEGTAVNPKHPRYIDAFQRSAPKEGFVPNVLYRIRDVDAFQRHALSKDPEANAPHWMRDGDPFQRLTRCKSSVFNARNGIRDDDVFQTTAPSESELPNTGHWIRDVDLV